MCLIDNYSLQSQWYTTLDIMTYMLLIVRQDCIILRSYMW